MNYLEIESVVGREILDSRGNPTVEAKITGSEKKFKTEEEALDNFITRLRALNVLKN